MKKIILLFSGAIASFFFLSYVDEYEALILPFFVEKKNERPPVDVSNSGLEKDLLKALVAFHQITYDAYMSADPSFLMRGQVDTLLSQKIAQEIKYLIKEGRIMDMRVSDIVIKKISPSSLGAILVDTSEIVEIDYYSNITGAKLRSYPPAKYDIRYSLNWRNNRWHVFSFETVGIRG